MAGYPFSINEKDYWMSVCGASAWFSNFSHILRIPTNSNPSQQVDP